MSHTDKTPSPALTLRYTVIALAMIIQVTAIAGCGGGTSQSSMMKEAMARRARAKSEEDEDNRPEPSKKPAKTTGEAPKTPQEIPPAQQNKPTPNAGKQQHTQPTPQPDRPTGDDDAPARPNRPTGDDDAPARPNRPTGDDDDDDAPARPNRPTGDDDDATTTADASDPSATRDQEPNQADHLDSVAPVTSDTPGKLVDEQGGLGKMNIQAARQKLETEIATATSVNEKERLQSILAQLDELTLGSNVDNTFKKFDAMRSQIAAASSSGEKMKVLKELVAQQIQFAKNNDALIALSRGPKAVVFSNNHKNLIQSWQTDYEFDGRRHRPVKLAISADMSIVTSALPPMQITPPTTSTQDEEEVTKIKPKLSPASVDVWRVFFKQRVRSWNQFGTERTQINGIRLAPDGQTVLTYPDVGMFHWKTGKSSELTPNCRLQVLHTSNEPEGVVIVGLDGDRQQQSNILKILGSSPLQSAPFTPFAQFGSRVTAIAAGNKSGHIAFAVRSRSGHRLFVADPRDLANTLQELESQSGYRQTWFDRQAPVGIQHLAFSGNDQLLLAYTEFGSRQFRATAFKLNWSSGKHEKLGEKAFKDQPLFLPYGHEPMRFVGKTNLVSLHEKKHVRVQDLEKGLEEVIKITLPSSQRGDIATDFSQDGNWLAAGNDAGEVYLWELETGRPVSLTAGRQPAHDGPIVGIAFSPLNPETGTTDYLVTAAESNTIRVWSLVDRLTSKAMSETEKRLKDNDAWDEIQGEDIRAKKALESKKRESSRGNR